MSTRTRRSQTADAASLKLIESLILAQAVWEHGANSWPAVAKILAKHPLISRPKSFFTAQSTHAMYENLMKEAGLERTDACNAVHSPINHKLAEKYYVARLQELRALVIAEENNFKALVTEIEDIRAGRFNAELKAQTTGAQTLQPELEPETQSPPPESSPEEAFGESELSGVTVTPASLSQSHEDEASEISTPKREEPQAEQKDIYESEVPVESPPITDEIPAQPPSPPLSTENELSDQKDDKDKYSADEHATLASPSSPVSGRLTETLISVHKEVGEDAATIRMLPDAQEREEEEEEEEEEEQAPRQFDVVEPEIEEKVGEEEEEEEEEEEGLKTADALVEATDEDIEMAQIQEEVVEQELVRDGVSEPPDQPIPSTTAPVAEIELDGDEGNTSGEEPLQISRRSTRRRRSTLSPVQPLQTRGKARRQRAGSLLAVKAEPEAEIEHEGEEVLAGSPNIDIDRDISPAALDSASHGKRKVSVIEAPDSPRDRKRNRDDSEPGDEDESGPSSHAYRMRRRAGDRTEEQVALKRFQSVIGMLHSQISQHRNGNIFHNPIKNSEAPDYHEIVKRPMDLKTIKMKIKDGAITNSLEYQRDIYLMFANAMMYNRPGTDVYSMAQDMMVESEGYISSYRQTEGLVRGAHRA